MAVRKGGRNFSAQPGHEFRPAAISGTATTETIILLTQMIQILVQAYEDHQITQQEASEIREKWERLKLQIEGYVVCCERRLFKDSATAVTKTKPGRTITKAR